jgi:hypothetical protein
VDWPPYLSLGGLEIANLARTLDYVRNGAAGRSTMRYSITGQYPQVLYRVTGQTPPFGLPATDPAPWHDASNPDSDDFLGLLLQRPRIDSTVLYDTSMSQSHPSVQMSRRRGAVADGSRDFVFDGTILAASAAGREYGRQWLDDTLAQGCNPCALTSLQLFDATPDVDDGSQDARHLFTYFDVSYTRGVTEQGVPDYGFPDWMDIQFTLTAANPMRYSAPQILLAPSVINPDGTVNGGPCLNFDDWFCGDPGPISYALLDEPLLGLAGAIFRITATGFLNGLVLAAWDEEPVDHTIPPIATMNLSLRLPDGSQLVVDASQERIWYTDPNGNQFDGSNYIEPPVGEPMPWSSFTADSCQPSVWVGVYAPHPSSYGATATIEIDEVSRRR